MRRAPAEQRSGSAPPTERRRDEQLRDCHREQVLGLEAHVQQLLERTRQLEAQLAASQEQLAEAHQRENAERRRANNIAARSVQQEAKIMELAAQLDARFQEDPVAAHEEPHHEEPRVLDESHREESRSLAPVSEVEDEEAEDWQAQRVREAEAEAAERDLQLHALRMVLATQPGVRTLARVYNTPEKQPHVTLLSNSTVLIGAHGETKHKDEMQRGDTVFQVDLAIPAGVPQADVYGHLQETLESYITLHNRVFMFAFGQSGAGKSYTCMGKDGEARGLMPRVVERTFQLLPLGVVVTLEMLEIQFLGSGEHLVDLLSNTPLERQINSIDNLTGEVPALMKSEVTDVVSFMQTYEDGLARRIVASTKLNDNSSRSHVLSRISLTNSEGKKVGQLNLIDLAGSENLSESEVQGVEKDQARGINSSLSALSMVMQRARDRERAVAKARREGLSKEERKEIFDKFFLPCRNSFVTQILRVPMSKPSSAKCVLLIAMRADKPGGSYASMMAAGVRPRQ